ncbi:MAG: flippase [Blastocatellia bacterium]
MMKHQEKQNSVLREAAWMIWSGTISIANSVALWAMFARWRNPAELGRFTIVMGIYMIFMTICALGLYSYTASETARRTGDERQQFVASITVFLFIWSVICAVLMTVTGLVVSGSGEVRMATAALSLVLLPTGLISAAEPALTALGRAKVIALVTTIENLLRTVIPLLLLWQGRSLLLICISFVVVRLLACLIYAGIAGRHLAMLKMARLSIIRDIAAHSPAFAGIAVLSSLHWQAASVLTGRLGSETEAAVFGSASRFLIPVMVLMGAYGGVLQPAATRLAEVSREALGEFISRSLRLVLALVLPCAIGLVLLAREVLTLLFSEKMAMAAPALQLMALSIVPFCAVMVLSRGLVATGNQRIDLFGNLIAVIVNLLLNFVLIPEFGAIGAAVAQFVSMMSMLALLVVFSARQLYRLELGQALLSAAIPLALMALVVWQARALSFHLAVLAGGAVYLACAWLTQRDLRMALTRQT